MARELLGNIKGPKGDTGPKGDKGEKGGFNNEVIGVVNKLDITKFTQFGTEKYITEFDVDEGVLYFTNLLWQMYTIEELNGVKHVFRVENYTSDPNYYQGLLRLIIRVNETDEEVINTTVNKMQTIDVDLSGKPRQSYRIELRPTGGNALSGIIEKPMLVEGDYSVLWNDSNLTTNYSEYRMYESKIPPNVETQLRPYHQGGDLLGNVDSELVVPHGVWLINWNFYVNTQSGDVRLRLYKDGELIADKLSSDGYENLSRLISVENGSSQLRFTVHNMGDNELTMSTAIRNNMQLKKL